MNYEDPNYNVSIPVFTIHGNHDDPAGVSGSVYVHSQIPSLCSQSLYHSCCHLQYAIITMAVRFNVGRALGMRLL